MDYATNVYYVIEGTFEVMRQQEIKKVNDHNVPKELIKVSGQQSASPFKRTNFSNEKSGDKHNIKIRTLNKGQIFGHDDVFNGRFCTSTVKCISNGGSLFMIKSEEFSNQISKDERAWAIIKRQSEGTDQNTLRMIRQFANRVRRGEIPEEINQK